MTDRPDPSAPCALPADTARMLLRAFLEAVPDAVYFKDAESRFVSVSRSKAQRHHLAPEALIGKTDADLFSPEHAQWTRVDEESIMATGEPVVGKLEKTVWRDGHASWSRTTKLPLCNEAGETIGTYGITVDATEEVRIMQDLEKTRRDLLDSSRLAGMAEVATGVLHNVGNVLTSLNVSANVVGTGLRYSKAESLAKLAALLQEHAGDLAEFITGDSKGRRVPEFLDSLTQHMLSERERLLQELASLQHNIDHIKEIITMQQAYATTFGVVESLDCAALFDDALRMNAGAMLRHAVRVVREFHPVPRIRGEKAKVLQILVNLLRNAKYAVDDGREADKLITVRVAPGASGRVQMVVADNGIGIPPENMGRIFQRGFTTRSTGHGFGLHSARQAASDLHGTLEVFSKGVGLGATFTLDLPAEESAAAA